MKKNYWFLCVLSLALLACGEDGDNAITPTATPTPDTTAPQIELFSPHDDATYLAVGKVFLHAYAKDDKGLKIIRLFMVDPSGARNLIKNISIDMVQNPKNKDFTEVLIPGSAVTGAHTIVVEAEDLHQNVTSKSVRIHVIAEDLAKLDFAVAFTSTGWFELVDDGDENLDLDEFNNAFYSFIKGNPWDYGTVPATVDEFGVDFGNHTQLGQKWDTDKDEDLSFSEFTKGLEELGFFKAWDSNKDNLISEIELAQGIKVLWDVDKNNIVTKEEFVEKLKKYFLAN